MKASDRHLFPGEACFPLSPSQSSSKKVEVKDQLRVILGVFGRLSERDTMFIKKNKEYFNSVYKKQGIDAISEVDFGEELPLATKPLVQLISGMLQFNPMNRPTAASLLQSPFFS